MNFLKKLLGKEDKPLDNSGFWDWFQKEQRQFHSVVKTKDTNNIDKGFLEKIMPKLQTLNKQFYCLTGMFDADIAELVITAEGDIKTFVFAEELVAAAPDIPGWRLTALKPPVGIKDMRISMAGFDFDNNKLSFFCNEEEKYPDVIDLTIVHSDFTDKDQKTITNGTFIYLDNALGELNLATLIDHIQVTGPSGDHPELIPIGKLTDFLNWKEKEFIEKYHGLRIDTADDAYTALEATDDNGIGLVALVNKSLLEWDAKASHPWLLLIEIEYGPGNNGMPDKATYELITQLEDDLAAQLPDAEGFLNLGRETYNGKRKVFLACKDFRRSSIALSKLSASYQDRLKITYDIYKDKYWQTMDQYQQHL
jgi:hypothetical protein